jgi:predicted ATPase
MTLAVEELAPWLAWASVLHGWATAMLGDPDRGIVQITHGLATWTAGGLACLRPYFLLLLAEAHKVNGQAEAARATVSEALAISERTGEGYAEAELHRLRGELQDDFEDAARSFRQAIEFASRQSARTLELRACVSWRHLEIAHRRDSSSRMVADAYGWFSEGFDTIDLKEAKALSG